MLDVRMQAVAQGHVIPPHLLEEVRESQRLLCPPRLELARREGSPLPRPGPRAPHEFVRVEAVTKTFFPRVCRILSSNFFRT